MTANEKMEKHLNGRGETNEYDGIPDTLYVAFAQEWFEVTSDPERADDWPYRTRVFEVTGHLND